MTLLQSHRYPAPERQNLGMRKWTEYRFPTEGLRGVRATTRTAVESRPQKQCELRLDRSI
jgi:hypothetical protein